MMRTAFNRSICTAVLVCVGVLCGTALGVHAQNKARKDKAKQRIERAMQQLPDSVFSRIKVEDLLDDEVYLQLAREGWSSAEIVAIMNTVMKDKAKAKQHAGYGKYKKEFLPYDGRLFAGDSLHHYIDPEYTPALIRRAQEAAGEDVYNQVWPKIVYNADDRKQGIRRPGYFRTVEHKPSSGRIRWGVVHPENPDWLYIYPDGTGIFKTYDGGATWACITDNIPDRADRSQLAGYSLPVDPDDWNHLFAMVGTKKVYETFDGGETWTKIEGATCEGFKRGYCFRDAQGTLRFICCKPNTHNSQLWISEDKCKTWTIVNVPNDMKEPIMGGKGLWFQQVEQDPNNRDLIYLPGSRSLYYFDDGARPTIENGVKKYNLKRKDIVVYADEEKTQRRMPADAPTDTKLFPIEATSPGFLVCSTLETNKMWFATGIRNTTQSALYYSDDHGETWVTLHDQPAGIGNSGCLFGNETAYSWLGGFGVNFADTEWMYGCSMSSAISSDGGRTFREFAWGNRLMSKQDDGKYYYVSNSRHNADNHFILSHKSGRVYRGSDGGLFVKDKEINNHNWTNIGSNMGQMLYYNIRCNEFGDQVMVGNTQDIDVQTYRYGRWGHWRGYEGSESWINPYTSTCYFSGGGGGGWEDMTLSSWRSATCWADVFTGSWYMSRTRMGDDQTFFRVDDTGRSVVNLYPNIGEGVRQQYALLRGKDHNTLVVYTNSNRLKKSIDGGNTFTTIKTTTGVDWQKSSITLASGSDEDNILYIASNLNSGNLVWRVNVDTGEYEDITYNLGGTLGCSHLIYHEGSGDLYFSNANVGIYILEKGSNQWRFWTKGYNPAKFGDLQINYTTQEMALSDYGRGAWVADLEHPADRFFKDGFELKELSHLDGRRTIGIDTKWTIPLYYYYEWKVNGSPVDNPYQYLTTQLSAGDQVQLKLTLRESPDVQTTSAIFTVEDTDDQPMPRLAGNALYSNGKGRVDLGYFDCFFNDFSVDFWLKPMGNGVILGNRQMSYDKGAKGWFMFVEGGQLKMRYSPRNIFSAPTYENGAQGEGNYTVSAGAIPLKQWSHVALTQERNGSIKLYINGECKVTSQRYLPAHTLNNSMYLSLFADAFEYNAIEAAVDELKIWNKVLTQDELRKEMFATNVDNQDGLVVRYDFNGSNLLDDTEAFTSYTPRVRTRAEVKHERMVKPIAAKKAFLNGDNALIHVAPTQEKQYSLGSFGYDAIDWMDGGTNLSTDHFDLMPLAYMVHSYANVTGTDAFDVAFKPAEGTTFDARRRYRLYYDDGNEDKSFWVQYAGELTHDNGTLKMEGMKASELLDRRYVIVALKPAIEVAVDGLGKTGELEVFTEDEKTTYPVHATLLEGLAEPVDGKYPFESTDTVLFTPAVGFEFRQGQATANLRVNHDKLPAFNQRVTTYLQGKAGDNKMIPYPVDVINRISPKELGNSVLLDHAYLTVGNTTDYTCMTGSNTVTMMGWIRLDSLHMLTDTTVKGLFFFRNSRANGLHLQNGNLRCHWNGESWSWQYVTPFTLTENDLGRWVHVAMVARPEGMDFYLNGAKHTIARALGKTIFDSPLLLGTDNNNSSTFSGAMDQVSIWNRSLTQEEVIKYMQERVMLNEPGLVAYITMDEMDGSQLVEVKNNSTIKETGRVVKQHRSIVPFNPVNRYTNAATHPEKGDADNHEDDAVALGSGTSFIHMESATATIPAYTITTFEGTSVGSYNPARPNEVPLSREFYTLIYESTPAYTEDDELTLYYHDENILDGDVMELGVRPLGAEQPFEIIATATGNNDTGAFTFPARLLSQAVEMNVFVAPGEHDRPIEIATRFGGGIVNGSDVMLSDDNLTIPFIVRVTSTDGKRTQLPIFVRETDYATLDKDTIDLTRTTATTYTVTIDKERLPNKFGLNPITINAPDEDDELHINVYLEPNVELRLKNGVDEHTFVATDSVSTLDIEAELVEGMFDKDVELSATSQVTTSLSIGGGTLLSDRPVTINQLEFVESPAPGNEMNEGWNLVGNPYLANVNLTKRQNVTYQNLTRFIYQYDKTTENYIVSDMIDYDEEQYIMPFQAYFVQALNAEGSITVTPTAREKKLSRKTFDHYTAVERTSLRLKLYANGKEHDRTAIIWEDGSDEDFVVNEDAAKMWSMTGTANQLFSMAGDKAAAINTLPLEQDEVPLGINVGTAGNMLLRVTALNGFQSSDKLYLVDNATGARQLLQPDAEYPFVVDQTGYAPKRFSVQVERDLTQVADPETAHRYDIAVRDRQCTVSGLQGDAHISIVDMSGRVVARADCKDATYSTTLPQGIYAVRIHENGKDYTAKIMVK